MILVDGLIVGRVAVSSLIMRPTSAATGLQLCRPPLCRTARRWCTAADSRRLSGAARWSAFGSPTAAIPGLYCTGLATALTRAAGGRLAPGYGWPVRRLTGVWYERRLLWCERLRAVCAACRSSNLAWLDGSVESAICRSSRCFQRAAAVSSWPPPPVGRGSWGLTPLAARHTAISRTRAVG